MKLGLVGSNDDKTTLLWMLTGQKQPNEGHVAVEPGIPIGTFNQNVGDAAG